MNYTVSPSTRAYANINGVDLDMLAQKTGRSSLAREDVDRYLAEGNSTRTKPTDASHYWVVDHSEYGPVHEEPLSRIAQITIANLSAANTQIPQVTHHDRADMRAVEAFRERIKSEAKDQELKLTAMAFHTMTLARCLIEFPKFNASLSPDADRMIFKDYVHIGVAVDTDYGLVVPVIRDVDEKGLWQLATEISDLAKRAQKRKIRPEEMGGASMTISNLGGIGGTGFTPIVNPPELAILGLSRTSVAPVWENDAWAPVPMMPMDLSYDHRAINGADAARFLTRYATIIGNPFHLIAG